MPNDEVFTATVLMNSDLTCKDIDAIKPDLYNQTTFDTNAVVINSMDLRALPRDGKIYHSVRSGAGYLAAVRARSGFLSVDDLRTTRQTIDRHIGTQWTASEAAETLATLASALTQHRE